MRKYINQLLSPLGYELRRIDPFEVQFARLLRTGPPPKFVQVGANDGVRFDGLYQKVTQYRCPGLAIEPLPDVFERLRLNYARHDTVTCLNVAVHASMRESEIYRVAEKALSRYPEWMGGVASFDRQHLTRHGVQAQDIENQRVQSAPLMEILDQHRCLNADVLQIDVEGYDAEVVKMIDFQRFRPRLLKFEHKNLSAAERASVNALLRGQGYQVARLSGDTTAWLPE